MKYISQLSFIGILLLVFLSACGTYEPVEDIKIPKYHTEQNVGIWAEQAGDHAPIIRKLPDRKIEVTVPFTPTFKPPHYVEVIALMQGEKIQIQAYQYQPSAQKPVAIFDIPKANEKYWVLIKCNLHGMWRAEVEPFTE